jgi:Ca2+-binding EF-hand superfamily protein
MGDSGDAVLSELQRLKIEHRFNLLDADDNGIVERADFELVAWRVSTELSFERDIEPETIIRLRKAYLALWDRLCDGRDANQDGKVSREEFVASIGHVVVESQGGYDQALRPIVDAVLDMLDYDGDGTVSRDEFRIWFRAYGVPPDEVDEAFSRLDLDHNGLLDRAEIQKAVEDFYTSDDVGSPGNVLFGVFGGRNRVGAPA